MLESDTLTREDAIYIIREYLAMSYKEFSELYNVQYHFLNDSLISKRPFSLELQSLIKAVAFKKLKSKK